MKFPVVLVAVTLLCGSIALAQEGPALDPKSLSAALAASPDGPEAERLADRIRAYFGGRDVLMRGAPARVDELTRRVRARGAKSAGNRPGAASRRGSRHVQSAAHQSWNERPVCRRCASDARRRVHVALRSRRRAIRRRPAGGVRNTSRCARARRRAERHAHADAVVEQQDFPGHHARLVGVRAGAVQRGKPGGGHGVSGRRRRRGNTSSRCSTT